MQGYTRIVISENTIRLRFEQIDSPGAASSFDRLRDDFYRNVPSARWDKVTRWMIVPNRDLCKVLTFCYTRFAPHQIRVSQESVVKSRPVQISMNF